MNKIMKTVAVTGSSGFVGKHLINLLKENGFQIIELDIQKGFDLTDWNQCKNIDNVDVIVHLAARSFVPDSFVNPRDFYTLNIQTTINALEIARLNKAKFIYFSSYLYGEPEYLPIDENHTLKPHNPYAQSKLIGEEICAGYHRDFGLPISIFRPFNIYGVGQNPSFLLPSIVNQLKSGKVVLKDPRPKRDFIHVQDVANAVMAAIHNNNNGLNTFNIGSGKSHSVSEIVSLLTTLIEIPVEVNYTNEYRQGEVLDTVADISKIASILNWKPSVNIENGLKSLI